MFLLNFTIHYHEFEWMGGERESKKNKGTVLIIFPKFKQYKLILRKKLKKIWCVCVLGMGNKFRSRMICFIVKQISLIFGQTNVWQVKAPFDCDCGRTFKLYQMDAWLVPKEVEVKLKRVVAGAIMYIVRILLWFGRSAVSGWRQLLFVQTVLYWNYMHIVDRRQTTATTHCDHSKRKKKQEQKVSKHNYDITLSTFINMISNGKFFNTLTRPLLWIAYRARKATFLCCFTFVTEFFYPSACKICMGKKGKATVKWKKKKTEAY